MGHPDFRVGGKIFATIWPDEGWGMVKLTPEQQHDFVHDEPAIFLPVKGGWGRQGATSVRLEKADEATVHRAMITAWRNTASKNWPSDLIRALPTAASPPKGSCEFVRV